MAQRRVRRPGLVVIGSFAVVIAVGTALLMLPTMTPGPTRTGLLDALFTATSAVTVTGLSVVDTPVHWSFTGQAVILGLIQIGGTGMAVTGTLLVLVIGRRLGLSTRMITQAESPGLSLGTVVPMVGFIVRTSLLIEAIGAVALTLRWWLGYGQDFSDALWNGVFHSVSAFNNAGFALFSTNLIGFNEDPVILVTMMLLIVTGGLGFPVWYQLRGRWRRPASWSMHVRLTMIATALLIVVGAVLITGFEWANPGTLGDKSAGGMMLNGLFASVTARTAGFNAIDYGLATEETLLVTSLLMFIGGGSASTAGGVKVTTIMVLALIVIAEARGDHDVNTRDRRIPNSVQRNAVAVASAYIALVTLAVLLLSAFSPFPLRDVLFESVSAIATTGLSTGITPELGAAGRIVIIGLMFTGRLGAMTLATALALRARTLPYRLPEGRPIVG